MSCERINIFSVCSAELVRILRHDYPSQWSARNGTERFSREFHYELQDGAGQNGWTSFRTSFFKLFHILLFFFFHHGSQWAELKSQLTRACAWCAVHNDPTKDWGTQQQKKTISIERCLWRWDLLLSFMMQKTWRCERWWWWGAVFEPLENSAIIHTRLSTRLAEKRFFTSRQHFYRSSSLPCCLYALMSLWWWSQQDGMGKVIFMEFTWEYLQKLLDAIVGGKAVRRIFEGVRVVNLNSLNHESYVIRLSIAVKICNKIIK